MATRANVAVRMTDGEIKSIYVHFDGYVSHLGFVLYKYYNSQEDAEKLIELGDCSSIGGSIESCVAYGRDSGEEGTEAIVERSFIAAFDEQYLYYWDNGEWNFMCRMAVTKEKVSCRLVDELRRLNLL